MDSAGKAELHAHTTFSDGSLTPEALVVAAAAAQLHTLAITDHDIVDGVAPALAAAATLDLSIVPGVEFSSNFAGREIHVLGLFIDHTNDALIEATAWARISRLERAAEIVDRLRAIGREIDLVAIMRAAGPNSSVGRPHIAEVLVERGHATSINEAFKRYLGIGRKAFVPKVTPDAATVIDTVHNAGGVAILAHPASSRVTEDSLRKLATLGLDGFEVDHPQHSVAARRKLAALIEELGLLPSGGSDFHGPGKGRTTLGAHAVPLDWMRALRWAAHHHRNHGDTTEGVI